MHLAQTPQFKVETVMATDKPQTLAYLALHQDYSADFVTSTHLDEGKCGELVVDRLLKGNRGHYGPLEHPSITLAIRADHPTIMQLRTHRHLTFDVQSMRYTSEHIVDVAEEKLDVEDVFYIRPVGIYESRQHTGYNWNEQKVQSAKQRLQADAIDYADDLKDGVAPEHARHYLGQALLQNCIVTGNLRSWLHLLEVRNKANAQAEVRFISDLIGLELLKWCPEVVSWWKTNRERKGVLAP